MKRFGWFLLVFASISGCDHESQSGALHHPTDIRPEMFLGNGAALVLEKSTNGMDADEPPGPTLAPGEEVVWEFRVVNTGDVAFSGVLITDDVEGVICAISDLAPGAEDVCQRAGVATAEPYANEGSALGTHMFGSVTAKDMSHYNGATRSIPAVEVDVKPDSESNCIQARSRGRLPVAILGSDGFDVALVDPETIVAGDEVEPAHWARDEDVDGDGVLDMILHFKTPKLKEAGLLVDGENLEIAGQTLEGGSFLGSDVINLVGGEVCRGR